jgi:hypothetical protein
MARVRQEDDAQRWASQTGGLEVRRRARSAGAACWGEDHVERDRMTSDGFRAGSESHAAGSATIDVVLMELGARRTAGSRATRNVALVGDRLGALTRLAACWRNLNATATSLHRHHHRVVIEGELRRCDTWRRWAVYDSAIEGDNNCPKGAMESRSTSRRHNRGDCLNRQTDCPPTFKSRTSFILSLPHRPRPLLCPRPLARETVTDPPEQSQPQRYPTTYASRNSDGNRQNAYDLWERFPKTRRKCRSDET